jgi:spermidine synthase
MLRNSQVVQKDVTSPVSRTGFPVTRRPACGTFLRGILAFLVVISDLGLLSGASAAQRDGGSVEFETKSTFSHIRVRRNGSVRSLIFVRDSGEEAYESQVNLRSPHILRFSYLQHMFTSYLFQQQQSSVMVVGLGGGSMIHFLQKYDPRVSIEAVEIDPVVVELAERYFAVRPKENVRLVVADAFDHLKKTKKKYDTIYMDAFLKPSASTDDTGVPLNLRTEAFYKELQALLTAEGSVVFNINPHDQMQSDIATIRAAFPQTYVFSLPNSEGVVVVGSLKKERMTAAELITAGKTMDDRFKAGFSFETLAKHLRSK